MTARRLPQPPHPMPPTWPALPLCTELGCITFFHLKERSRFNKEVSHLPAPCPPSPGGTKASWADTDKARGQGQAWGSGSANASHSALSGQGLHLTRAQAAAHQCLGAEGTPRTAGPEIPEGPIRQGAPTGFRLPPAQSSIGGPRQWGPVGLCPPPPSPLSAWPQSRLAPRLAAETAGAQGQTLLMQPGHLDGLCGLCCSTCEMSRKTFLPRPLRGLIWRRSSWQHP